jgi:hypothetical protein
MRGRLTFITAVLAFALVAPAATASSSPVLPYNSSPYGHSYRTWFRMVGQFYLGDSSNPLIAALSGECGQMIDGAFFMAAPIDVGIELDCSVPAGTPIVLSHAAQFATKGIDGQTDRELVDAAKAGFTTSADELTLDGAALPLKTIGTGAYNVISETGSFYDAIIGVGTGPIRTAVVGNVVVLHPLTPGDHDIHGAVSFVSGAEYSATYDVHVG